MVLICFCLSASQPVNVEFCPPIANLTKAVHQYPSERYDMPQRSSCVFKNYDSLSLNPTCVTDFLDKSFRFANFSENIHKLMDCMRSELIIFGNIRVKIYLFKGSKINGFASFLSDGIMVTLETPFRCNFFKTLQISITHYCECIERLCRIMNHALFSERL